MNKNTDEKYRSAINLCLARYITMPHGDDLLSKFIAQAQLSVWTLSLPKLNRWLGYIQGVLIAQGFTTVQEERDWTRGLFKPLDDQIEYEE